MYVKCHTLGVLGVSVTPPGKRLANRYEISRHSAKSPSLGIRVCTILTPIGILSGPQRVLDVRVLVVSFSLLLHNAVHNAVSVFLLVSVYRIHPHFVLFCTTCFF